MVIVMSWGTTITEWFYFPKTGLPAGIGRILWLQGRGELRHTGFEQGLCRAVQRSVSLLSACLLIIFVYLASLLTLCKSALSGYVACKGQGFLSCFPILFSPSSP